MKLSYETLLEKAEMMGRISDKKLVRSLKSIQPLLCMVEKTDPEKYMQMMIDQHCIFFGPHYTEELACHQVEKMRSVNAAGKECTGQHWSVSETEEATKAYSVPSGYNKWDVYVALNSFWHDVHSSQKDEQQIIADAVSFYLKDEDGPDGKPFVYMKAMMEAKQKQISDR